LYSALHGQQTTLKRSGMDDSLPAINTIPTFYFVSVHQMAPPPIEVANNVNVNVFKCHCQGCDGRNVWGEHMQIICVLSEFLDSRYTALNPEEF